MFKIIHKACAAVCLCLFFLTGSICGLSPRDFLDERGNNFSLWLGADKEVSLPWHYSPFWGVVLLQSGFMKNMRFCGNKTLDYFKKNETLCGIEFKKGERKYYDVKGGGDKGNSAIEELQKELFGSVAGGLNHFVNHGHNIGYKINHMPKERAYESVATLLVITEILRILEKYKDTNTGLCDLSSIKEIIWRTKKPLGEDGIRKDKEALDKIKKNLEYHHKGRKTNLEEKHNAPESEQTAEEIFCDIKKELGFSDAHKTIGKATGSEKILERAKNALKRIDLNKELKSQMKGNFLFDWISKAMISVDDLHKAIKDEKYLHEHAIEHFLLAFASKVFSSKEDMQAFLKEYSKIRKQIFNEAYINRENTKNTSEIVTSAKDMCDALGKIAAEDMPYDDDPGENATTSSHDEPAKEFADCVETSIRHIFNLVLGESGIANFNAEELKIRVKNFNKKHKPIGSSSGADGVSGTASIPDRIEALKNFYHKHKRPQDGVALVRKDWNEVVYGLNKLGLKNKVEYRDAQDRLVPGFFNAINVFIGVLGIDPEALNAHPCIEKAENIKDCIQEALKILFKVINEDKEYALVLGKQEESDEDVYGDLTVTVTKAGPAQTVTDAGSTQNDSKRPYEFIIKQDRAHNFVELPDSKVELTLKKEAVVSEDVKSLAGYVYENDARCSYNIYSKVFGYSTKRDIYALTAKATKAIYEKYKTTKNINAEEIVILKTFVRNIFRDKHEVAIMAAERDARNERDSKEYGFMCGFIVPLRIVVSRECCFNKHIFKEVWKEILNTVNALNEYKGAEDKMLRKKHLKYIRNIKGRSMKDPLSYDLNVESVESMQYYVRHYSPLEFDEETIKDVKILCLKTEVKDGKLPKFINLKNLSMDLRGIKTIDLSSLNDIDLLDIRNYHKGCIVSWPKSMKSLIINCETNYVCDRDCGDLDLRGKQLKSIELKFCTFDNVTLQEPLLKSFDSTSLSINGKLNLVDTIIPSFKLGYRGKYGNVTLPETLTNLNTDNFRNGTVEVLNLSRAKKMSELKLEMGTYGDIILPPTLTSFDAINHRVTMNGKIYTDLPHNKLNLPDGYPREKVLPLKNYVGAK